MTFQSPFWLIVAVLLVVGYLFVKVIRSTDDWYRILPTEVLNYLQGDNPLRRHRLNGILVAAICAAALAGPSVQTTNADTYTQSSGWIVLADLSRSMTLNDISPSRLSAMRDVAEALASQASANPLALIIYAGDAFLVTPPAFDTAHYRDNVSLLEHGLVPIEGSDLTRALALATSVIESNKILDSRLIVLSDTGGITAAALSAVARLSAAGHTTDTIVFGTENTAANAEFDLTAARKLAHTGNGKMLTADALGKVSLDALELDSLTYGKGTLVQSGIELLRWSNQSHWLLLFAIPLMLGMFARARL